MIDELLDLDKKLKSITYVIRTEESLHPFIKNFRSYFGTTINQ